jgi:AraC-like DNA-binding protein
MLETILHFFIFYAGILALMMALGQLVERQKNAGNYIMSAFLCCVGVYQLYHGAMISGLLLEYPHLGLLHVPFLYFAGPLLYFFFKQLGKLDFRFRKVYLLHFAPGLLLILALLPFYMKSAEEKRQFLQCPPALGSRVTMLSEYTIIILFIMISITVYLILFLKESTYLWNRKYLRLKRVAYLSHLIIVTTCTIIFVYFTGFLLINIFSFSHDAYLTLITVISVATCILVLLIYLMGKRYPEYFREFQREVERIRYEISRIEGLNVEAVLRHLNRLMEEEKVFCDEDMTLNRLADELSIAPYQLSQILNEKLNKNFNRFINEYRVQEARKLLVDECNRAISSIAYAVGFNSLSVFYDWFLKVTGTTPGKYRERQRGRG